MYQARSLVLMAAGAVAVVGCSDDNGGGGAIPGGSRGADGGAADAASDGFARLITASWALQPGETDVYRCAKVTVTEDSYVVGLRAIAPLGTHHTVLTVGQPSGVDGEFACRASTGLIGFGAMPTMLFASGVGSDEFRFPPGVAVKVPAGQQLTLNLHLFNASDGPLEGLSGIEVVTIPAAEVEQLAEMIFAGTLEIELPPSAEPQTVPGECEFAADATLLNIWPHMHTLGTHMRVSYQGEVLHDRAYTFDEQVNWPIDLAVTGGSKLEVACTYVNDTGHTVSFGDSTLDEMCFAGVYRYPALNQGVFCAIGAP
jgi:hypothetical protein